MQALSQLSYTPTRKGSHYSRGHFARNRAALRKDERAAAVHGRAKT